MLFEHAYNNDFFSDQGSSTKRSTILVTKVGPTGNDKMPRIPTRRTAVHARHGDIHEWQR
jgi:hypothetical protein